MYLQVETLSDIVNLDRRTINNHFFEGNKPVYPSSTFRWLKQSLPSPKALNLLRMIIVHQICNLSDNNTLPIRQKLTQWIIPYPLRQMYHRWNYSREKDEIYELHQDKVYQYFINNKDSSPTH